MQVEANSLPDPSVLAARIRAAVQASEYRKAERLLDQYAREARVMVENEPVPERRAQLLREIQDLLKWAQTVTLAARSRDVQQLEKVPAQKAYSNADALKPPSWQFDA